MRFNDSKAHYTHGVVMKVIRTSLKKTGHKEDTKFRCTKQNASQSGGAKGHINLSI